MRGLPALDRLVPLLRAGIQPAHARFVVHGLHEQPLAGAEALGKADVAWTNDVAAPAFDAIEKTLILENVELVAFCRMEQVLSAMPIMLPPIISLETGAL